MNKYVTKMSMLVFAVALTFGLTSCESEYSKESNELIQKYSVALTDKNLQESRRLSNVLENRKLNSKQTTTVRGLNQNLSEWESQIKKEEEERIAAQRKAEEERKKLEEEMKKQVPSWLLGRWVSDKIEIDPSTYDMITTYLDVSSYGYKVTFSRSSGGGYHLDFDWEGFRTEGDNCYDEKGKVVFSINRSHTKLEYNNETWSKY